MTSPGVGNSLAEIFEPPRRMRPSEWASENLIMPDGQRAGGRWDKNLTPYVPDIIDALSAESEHNFVAVRKGVQVGISMAGIALCGYYIDMAPCRIGYALPTIHLLHEFASEKLQPTITGTPALNDKIVPYKTRAPGSTTTRKKYPGGAMSLINANSSTDLKSRTLKVGVADEIDAWQALEDGDSFSLYMDRFTFFHSSMDYKILSLSTPSLVGTSRITEQFEKGDQRFWHVKCPGCKEEIVFEFEHLKFNKTPPYEAHYVAPCCGSVIGQAEKTLLIREGRYVATSEDGLYPSFHIDALSSLVTTWDHIAEAWWDAWGDWQKEQRFWNSQLGLAYTMRGDAPDWQRLFDRREDYPENRVPEPVILLTAGVDVQANGLYYEVIGFAIDKQNWTVTAGFIEGDTEDHRRGAWRVLDELYESKIPDAFGGTRRIEAMLIDAGYRSNTVYSYCRGRDRAHACDGRSGWVTPAISSPTRVDVTVGGKKYTRGALLWPVGTWALKGDIYASLRKQKSDEGTPAGYAHFGQFLGEQFFKQLTAEYLEEETFRGRPRKVWKQSFEANHYLDCRVYAFSAAHKLGLDRMSPDDWRRVAAQIGVPKIYADMTIDGVRIGSTRPAQKKRRKRGKSDFMN